MTQPTIPNRIPEHVPPALVREYNFYELEGGSDFLEHFRKLHDWPDIFWSPRIGGHWVVSRFADMEEILLRPEDFSSLHQTIPNNPIRIPMLEDDGRLHREFRHILQPFFSPANIARLEAMARKLSVSLIEGFVDRGECEFVTDFSLMMPISIIMHLMDLPAEHKPFLVSISEDIVRNGGDSELKNAAFARAADYIATEVIPARRARPGNDLFSAIMAGSVDGGRKVSDEEIVGLGSLLIAAGLDTVVGMMGFICLFLARHPAHRQQLIDDPALIKPAIEEMMRRYSLANIARTVTRDLEFRGVRMRAGDDVQLMLTSAGIDDRRYADPLRVDFRRGEQRSLTFGRGPHMCIGIFLARTELRVFLQEWLPRIPHWQVQEGETPLVLPGSANSVRYLPITWPAR